MRSDSQMALVRIVGPDRDEQLVLSPEVPSVIIGRDDECDVVLADPAISRRHLRLELSQGALFLEDLSSNGTAVNGALVRQEMVPLERQALIRIGAFELHVALPPVERGSHKPVANPDHRAPTVAATRTATASVELRRKIRGRLVDHLDLLKLERARMNPKLLRGKVDIALREITQELASLIPAECDVEQLIRELRDEAVGLGPLEAFLADPAINEIMVVNAGTIYVEQDGQIVLTEARFTDDEALRATLERIVTPLGRRIDESAPMLDARLPDGSRVNAVIPPLATKGACVTIRKFSPTPLSIDDLQGFGSLSPRMAKFLMRSVMSRKNVIVAGGTGSGKTTLLNVLSAFIPEGERIVTIEDSAELQLQQPHVITLEARPANMEGRGEVTIRDLVKNAMRMRPDRVVVGECRGGEALDMLLAMNTGHDGSMTTTHANSPHEALRRIETLALMSGLDLPARALREQIAYAVDLLIHQHRFADGTRKVTSITEVVGMDADGAIETREIFGFRPTGTTAGGRVEGEFYATGYLPSYLPEFLTRGIAGPEEELL